MTADEIAAFVAKSRKAQSLPPRIEDPAALGVIARLVVKTVRNA